VKRAGKRAAIAGSPFPVDPRRYSKELIDRLTNDVAIHALADIDAHADKHTSPGIINASGADAINIWGGKEDLEAHAGHLFGILDGIPDNQEREAAFWALYHVIHGTFNIAKSGIYPLDEMRHSQALQAAVLRARRERTITARNAIIQSVIDEAKKQGKLPSAKRELLDLVNARLASVGKDPIKIGTLYRWLRK
jgi:hypothetical protein